MAVTATQKRDLQNNADKHLELMSKSVHLLKEIDFPKFLVQLQRAAMLATWDPKILNSSRSETELTQDEIDAANLDEATEGAIKATLDRRNAWLIVMNKTDGHPVESLLESLPGINPNPRKALEMLHEYFHPSTQAGKSAQIMIFYGLRQATCNLDVIAFIALVHRHALTLRGMKVKADEDAEISVILTGLLPEFNQIKMVIEQAHPPLNLQQVVAKITAHAVTSNLLNLKKGGHQRTANTYLVRGNETKETSFPTRQPELPHSRKQECRKWRNGECPFGDDCLFQHEGEGSAVPNPIKRSEAPPKGRVRFKPGPPPKTAKPQPESPNAPTCLFCKDEHQTSACPAISDAEVNYTYMVGETAPAQLTQSKPFQLLQLISGILLMLFVYCVVLPATTVRSIINAINFNTENARVLVLAAIVALLCVYPALAVSVDHVRETCYFNENNETTGMVGYEYCVDSATTRFVTNNIDDFLAESIVHHQTVVHVGSGNTTSELYGTVLVRSSTGKTIACTRTLYMPSCKVKLMPVSTFTDQGCKVTFSEGKVYLLSKDGEIIFEGKQIEKLFYFKSATIPGAKDKGLKHFAPSLITDPPKKSFTLFGLPVGKRLSEAANDFHIRLLEVHQAYGHLNFDELRKYLGLKKGPNPHCAACAVAKSRTAPLNKPPDRSTRILHRLHGDIGYTAGSTNPFQLYVDDYTRVSYIDLLTSKDEVMKFFIELRAALENRFYPWKLAFWQTDNEFVYTTNAWIDYCRDTGLEHEFSPPYRHDGLGVVERAMQTVGVSFRCMMFLGNAPATMIPYALVHANTIRNHSPTKANNGWTPLEKEAGRKLPLNERLTKGVLFCLVYIHVYDEQREKHDPRGIPSVYLGFDAQNNQFIAMEWLSGKIRYVGDGTFQCSTFPFRVNPSRVPEWMTTDDRISPTTAVSGPSPAPHSLPTGPRRSLRQHGIQYTGGVRIQDVPDIDVPPDGSGQDGPAVHAHLADEPPCDLLLSSSEQELPAPESYFIHPFGKDPTNWKEALDGPHANEWIAAMLTERESFRHHGVYVLVPRAEAAGHKIFKSRVVLKMKLLPPTADAPNGSIEKFRYRLTIAAFTSMLTEGIDYKEKHSSQVKWNSLKLLIANAVLNDWDLLHIDIKTFFLYGEFDKDTKVFMEQPEGWDTPEQPASKYVCRLVKTCYGHPAASNESQKVLNTAMVKDGKFERTTADDCVYVSTPATPGYAAAGAHVDDILSTGDKIGLTTLQATLEEKFELTAKLNPTLITGVQISRDRPAKWCKLHQTDYVKNLLDEWKMSDCIAVDTPMDPGTARALMLITEVGTDADIITKFQSLVGALLWLYKTRPDLAYATNLLARFCRAATLQHLKLAMRVLRYLRGTVDYGLVFQAGSTDDGVITAEADADLAGDLVSSRSTSGFYAKFGKCGLITFNSWLERKISTSTGQAETYALASLVRELVWIRQLSHELRIPQTRPTVTGTDNQGVHVQSTKAINHATAKHFRISQAYIRSKSDDGTIKVVKVVSDLNHADYFTKPLCFKLFAFHRFHTMGPQDPPKV